VVAAAEHRGGGAAPGIDDVRATYSQVYIQYYVYLLFGGLLNTTASLQSENRINVDYSGWIILTQASRVY